MSVIILTEEQSKTIASECAEIALKNFISEFYPEFSNTKAELGSKKCLIH